MAKEIIRRFGTTAEHSAFTGAANEITVDSDKNTVVVHDGSTAGGFPLAKESAVGTAAALDAGAVTHAVFTKTDADTVSWTKTGNGTAETAQVIYVGVGDDIVEIASGTSISMPTLSAGTDYAIWCAPDGSLEADTSFTSAPTSGARLIGGFHYAPGGNASGQSGGDSTAQINEYSFWDLRYRPACEDPRGMTLVAGGFWADIYLTGVDHHVNGTSAYNVTIADGSSAPKVPSEFGGNGSTTYGSYTWYEAAELLASHGKKLPTQQEFMALAYGTTEETSRGSDPGSTGLDSDYTSKWGVMQSTGVMRVWGNHHGGEVDNTDWADNTDGRGESYYQPSAVLFGGFWTNGSRAGSRFSRWGNAPSDSGNNVGSRGVCDHLRLD